MGVRLTRSPSCNAWSAATGWRLPGWTPLAALAKPAVAKVELGRVLVADEIVRQLLQPENLPLGETLQVGEHRHRLLPMVADPSERIEGQAEQVTPEVFQQALGQSAGPRRVGGQLRPVPGDSGQVGRAESGPELRQLNPLPHMPLPIPRMAVQFALQLQAQDQHFLAGQVKPVALSPRDRLERQVLEKQALLGAAETDAPGDAAAGVTGQP